MACWALMAVALVGWVIVGVFFELSKERSQLVASLRDLVNQLQIEHRATVTQLQDEKRDFLDRYMFPQVAFERSAPSPPPSPPPHRIADEWGLNDEELDDDEAQEIADAITAEVE